MASPCEVHVAGADRATAERILALAAGEAARIEGKFSRYRRGNVIDAINTAEGRTVTVDEETARLLDYAAQLFELSDGKFDVTSGVLRRVWRFDGSDRVPSRKTVAALLPIVGWDKVQWQAPHLTLAPGMEVDLGGIGKEYAVDRAGALVRSLSTHCLLNFGGDLLALGPQAGGEPWRVGIESVRDSATAARHIDLAIGALATSGDARRYLLKDGRRYGHILDPTTGWPVVDAPRSITVAADTCTQAGMLATLALLQGRAAEAFLAAQGVQYWALR
jgi:thiamine biosynthesis lipoprotein